MNLLFRVVSGQNAERQWRPRFSVGLNALAICSERAKRRKAMETFKDPSWGQTDQSVRLAGCARATDAR